MRKIKRGDQKERRKRRKLEAHDTQLYHKQFP